jgi:hypothetical protein
MYLRTILIYCASYITGHTERQGIVVHNGYVD